MDKTSEWINRWIVFSKRTRELFEKKQGRTIDSLEFQQAFAESCGKNTGIELVYVELPTPEDAFDKLKDYRFASEYFELIEEVHLEEDVLPEGTPRLITEETVRSKGQVWRIHANDKDPFPSSSHAHNLESGLKLHLGTGQLFRKTQSAGRVKCKHLKLIRGAIKKVQLPPYACK
jgi:hypothetical protein